MLVRVRGRRGSQVVLDACRRAGGPDARHICAGNILRCAAAEIDARRILRVPDVVADCRDTVPCTVSGPGSCGRRLELDARERDCLRCRNPRLGRSAFRCESSRVTHLGYRDCALARGGAQQPDWWWLLSYDLTVRSEFLYWQSCRSRWHVPVAAVRPRSAGIRATGCDRTGRIRTSSEADACSGVELLDTSRACVHCFRTRPVAETGGTQNGAAR